MDNIVLFENTEALKVLATDLVYFRILMDLTLYLLMLPVKVKLSLCIIKHHVHGGSGHIVPYILNLAIKLR